MTNLRQCSCNLLLNDWGKIYSTVLVKTWSILANIGFTVVVIVRNSSRSYWQVHHFSLLKSNFLPPIEIDLIQNSLISNESNVIDLNPSFSVVFEVAVVPQSLQV